METGSVLSEPSTGSRGFSAERSLSMTILSPQNGQPRMSHLETLEAKMASIEVSLSSTAVNTPRRRKGTSLGGGSTISARASPRPSIAADTISLQATNGKSEHRSALQEREAIIQNLRLQLGLGKLPRPTGTPLDESERPAAEQRLQKLRNEADNKRVAIRNLKSALEKLDITDNIDVRIRQAEIEYALGREELHLLSVVEEIRALQQRLDKSLKSDATSNQNSLFTQISNGMNFSLHAIKGTLGRFSANTKHDMSGLYVEWALDGEGLHRNDRIIECNGKVIALQTKEEFQKVAGTNGKCDLVVIRKRSPQQNQQLLIQSQEDNQRLQHRISYLEDQVKELQHSTKEIIAAPMQNNNLTNGSPANGKNGKGDHVTSISISSTPTSPKDNEKPQIYQRGNFVATIIGGKAIQTSAYPVTSTHQSNNSNSTPHSMHTTKTMIKEMNGNIVSDSEHDIHYRSQRNGLQHSQSQQYIGTNSKLFSSASKISINSDSNNAHSVSRLKDRQREYLYKENRRIHRENMDRHNSHPNLLNGDSEKHDRSIIPNDHYYEPSVNEYSDGHSHDYHRSRHNHQKVKPASDIRSARSLDFEKEMKLTSTKQTAVSALYRKPLDIDYTSEPVATPLSSSSRPRNGTRPTPPKKPLRLSLQRTQSLQTIEANATAAILDLEKKRAIKRTHRGNKTPDLPHFIENGNIYHSASHSHLQTSSLGRNRQI